MGAARRSDEREDLEHGRLGRAPQGGLPPGAVGAVLDDVEIEGAEVDGEEIEQGVDDRVVLVVLVGLADAPPDLFRPVEDPAVEVEELARGNGVRGRVKAVEVAEEEAPGVADLAVGLDEALLDLLAEAGVLLVVQHGHPEPEDLGAAAGDDLAAAR